MASCGFQCVFVRKEKVSQIEEIIDIISQVASKYTQRI